MADFELVPLADQDKLREGLLRTTSRSYLKATTTMYWIDGTEKGYGSIIQDKLREGLVRFPNGSYHPIDSISRVRESDCFIATTVYGDRDAPQVRMLRDFRDNVLMESPAGRAFVDFYYNGAGRRSADFINEHLPLVIPVLRKGLNALVEMYSIQTQ